MMSDIQEPLTYTFTWNEKQPERIDPELKAAWIMALSSGEYRQGKDALKNNNGGYCCLGVLCDVLVKSVGDDDKYQWSGPLGREFSYWSEAKEDFEHEDACLPPSLTEDLGFLHNDVQVAAWRVSHGHDDNFDRSCPACMQDRDGETRLMLTVLNDVYKMPFSQLADLIDYFL